MKVVTEKRQVARGLNAMARRLGVSRGHLSQVVHGKRRSRRLEARIDALNKMAAEEGGAA